MRTRIILSSIYLLSMSLQAKELNFGTIDYCPFVCKNNTERPGIMIEIAKRIFRDTDYQINLDFMSLKRAMDKSSDNLIDGFILGSKVHFKDNFFPDQPTLSQPIYFFTTTNSKWFYKDINSLKKVSIGAIENFNYMNKEVTNHFKKSKTMTWLNEENAHKRAFQLLDRKRVQTFIGGSYTTQYLAEKLNPLSKIKVSSPAIGHYDNYISLNSRLSKKERKISYT